MVGCVARWDRLWANFLQVDVGSEEPDGGIHVVDIDDQLPDGRLGMLKLTGNLCPLSDQTPEDMLVFHPAMILTRGWGANASWWRLRHRG